MNIAAALTHLAQAGWKVAALAAELKVHRSSVYRWRKHTRPTDAHLDALRTLVDDERRRFTYRHTIPNTPQVRALQAAAEALVSDEQKAADDALAARLRADLTATGVIYNPQEAAAEQAWLAESVAQAQAATARPVRPATAWTSAAQPFQNQAALTLDAKLDAAFGPA